MENFPLRLTAPDHIYLTVFLSFITYYVFLNSSLFVNESTRLPELFNHILSCLFDDRPAWFKLPDIQLVVSLRSRACHGLQPGCAVMLTARNRLAHGGQATAESLSGEKVK